MRRKLTWLAVSAAIIIVALYQAEFVRATPGNGFTGTTLATGTFGAFQVFNQLPKNSLPTAFDGNVWLSFQKTQGPSDLYVQTNVWQPGGTTGWHTHPGHSLIIITAGEVTVYDSDCTPHVYGPGTALGSTLVDPGGSHVHLIRNEGSVGATGMAVQLVPKGATRRIDAPAPQNCQSIL